MRRNLRIAPLSVVLLSTLLLSCTSVRTAAPTSTGPIPLDEVPVQYGFGLKITETFAMSPEDWALVEAAFTPRAGTSAAEREQIREAVAIMERRAGRTTPAREDMGRNETVPGTMGQMDCINESTNTTTYLRVFQQEGLMRRHAVIGRAYRASVLLDAHYSAQIVDVTTGERFAVDSWYLANGFRPVIQPTAAWGRKDSVLPATSTAAAAP